MTPNGIAIGALRRAQKMSLAELATRSGLSRSYLSRLERGLTGASDETLRRLAAALTVSPADITRGDHVSTQLKPKRACPSPSTPEGELFHYTPEEAEQYLPWSARVLRNKARAHEIPHNRGGARITFTGLDIREISAMTAVRPLSEAKRKRTPTAA